MDIEVVDRGYNEEGMFYTCDNCLCVEFTPWKYDDFVGKHSECPPNWTWFEGELYCKDCYEVIVPVARFR